MSADHLEHTVALPYGRSQVEVTFPPDYEMAALAARSGRALVRPDEAVRRALRHPTAPPAPQDWGESAPPAPQDWGESAPAPQSWGENALPALREWVRPGERVAIVTSDATRPALQATYLPQVLEELEAAGVAREDVLLVIGLGTHRPPTGEEINNLLGEAAGRYRVIWSDCDDEAALVNLGTTRRGTPVRIFRPVAGADRVILTGSINHHVMAGFSAGPKSLLPGVAARDSILANHALALNPVPPGGLNPMCDAGVLSGNPIHEDIVDALELFPVPVFLVNVVPAPEGGLLQAVAGDPMAAHRSGCRTADQCYALPLAERRSFVFASCGGYPSDISFYQSTKGLINLGSALADGGVGVLLAESAEGPGGETFLAWLRHGSPEAIETGLRRTFTVPGRVAHYVAALVRRATIILVSTLDPALVRELGLIPAASPQAAVDLAVERLGPRTRGYLLPKASVTVPVATDRTGSFRGSISAPPTSLAPQPMSPRSDRARESSHDQCQSAQ